MRNLIIIVIIAVIIIGAYTALAGSEIKSADCIIGLGFGPAKNKKGEPSNELKRRVDKAVELYQKGLAPYIIFTGADTGGGCEAVVMKELAIKAGVPAEKIITEEKATDTITNTKYSVEIMRQKGFKKAILVSNPYHLKRAKYLFEANPGIEIQLAPCDTPKNPFYHIIAFSYEALVWLDYFFMDAKDKARADLITLQIY